MRSRKSPDSGAGMTSPPTHQNRPPRISIPDSAQHKSALEQGTGFAAAAARGCLAGAAAEAGFCLAYAIAARKGGWICSLAAGTLAFATGAALFQSAHPPLWMSALLVYAALTTALSLMPKL